MVRRKPTYDGIKFDSNEEREMYWWCEEAETHELIESFEYQPPAFPLFDSVKQVFPQTGVRGQVIKPKEKSVLRALEYTLDFRIRGIDPRLPITEWIDIKPAYEPRRDRAKYFTAMQKWTYQRHGVLVEALIPTKLFELTFCPANAFLSWAKKQRRPQYQNFRTVSQYVEDLDDGV